MLSRGSGITMLTSTSRLMSDKLNTQHFFTASKTSLCFFWPMMLLVMGGMVMFIEEGRLKLVYNGFGEYHRVLGPDVPAGHQTARLEYEALGKRRGRERSEELGHRASGP